MAKGRKEKRTEITSSDPRFAAVANDPRFKSLPRRVRKVKVDSRFQAMLTDANFANKSKVDARGRVLSSTPRENLRKFYDMPDSDEEGKERTSAEEEEEAVKPRRQRKTKEKSEEDDDADEDEDHEAAEDDDDEATEKEGDEGTEEEDDKAAEEEDDKAAEEEDDDAVEKEDSEDGGDGRFGQVSDAEDSDDSDQDDSDSLSAAKDDIVHDWAAFDTNVDRTEDLSCRLAVCNVDWDRVGAKDLLVLLQSFKPRGGSVKSVTIYPSEYGQEQLAKEDVLGPVDLRKETKEDRKNRKQKDRTVQDEVDDDTASEEEPSGDNQSEDDGDHDDDDDSNDDNDELMDEAAEQYEDDSDNTSDEDTDEDEAAGMEKIRQYQLNRLKYYYAVVEFDSKETASAVYEQCDGLELELSQSRLDLRFVPDDMVFDQEIKDKASEGESAGYQPLNFFTSALQQSKVTLTWDETDKGRLHTTMRKFTADDIRDMDFKAYLASGSEDEADSDAADAVQTKKVTRQRKADRGSSSVRSRGQASNSRTEEDTDGSEDGGTVRGSRAAPPGKSGKSSSYNKYRALMDEINGKEKADGEVEEMQVTFQGGFSDKDEEDDNDDSDEAESVRGKKKAASKKKKTEKGPDSQLTAWDKYQKDKKRKQRQRKKLADKGQTAGDDDDDDMVAEGDETPQTFDFDDPFFTQGGDAKESQKKSKKKKKKRLTEEEQKEVEELKLLMVDEDDENSQRRHFSLKAILEQEKMEEKGKSGKKMRRKRKHIDADDDASNQPSFEMDLNDPRFEAIYTEHKFAVDPSDSHFKETKGMKAIVGERHRRRQQQRASDEQTAKDRQQGASSKDQHQLSVLMKSVRAKTGNFKRAKV